MTEESLENILRGRLIDKSAVMTVLNEGNGQKLDVQIRNVHAEEREIQSKRRRSHTFGSVDGMLRYLERYKTKHTVIFADPSSMEMTVVVDESTEKVQEILSMCPLVHPLWLPWVDVCGATLELRALVDFLRSNRRAIIRPDGRELVLALSQIKSSTEIELHEGRGNGSINGVLIKSKIQGNQGASTVDLPDSITVESPIFIDEPKHEVEIDLTLDSKIRDGKPTVFAALNSADLKSGELSLFESMCERVHKFATDNEIVFSFGESQYRDWPRVND